MAIFNRIRKHIAQSRAEARGISRENFDKYWEEREKHLGKMELQKSREYEEKKIAQKFERKANRGIAVRKAFKSGLASWQKSRKRHKGIYRPPFGGGSNPTEVRVRPGTW